MNGWQLLSWFLRTWVLEQAEVAAENLAYRLPYRWPCQRPEQRLYLSLRRLFSPRLADWRCWYAADVVCDRRLTLVRRFARSWF
jgi:hypothetical protein